MTKATAGQVPTQCHRQDSPLIRIPPQDAILDYKEMSGDPYRNLINISGPNYQIVHHPRQSQ